MSIKYDDYGAMYHIIQEVKIGFLCRPILIHVDPETGEEHETETTDVEVKQKLYDSPPVAKTHRRNYDKKTK